MQTLGIPTAIAIAALASIAPRAPDPLDGLRVRSPNERSDSGVTVVELAGFLASSSPHADVVRYELVREASWIRVRTSSSGLFSAFGHDHDLAPARFTVDLQADPAALESTKFVLSVDAGSLQIVDKESQDDRDKIERETREKVLEVARFPTIDFKSTRVAIATAPGGAITAQVTGDLLLHGKTRSITVPAKLEIAGAAIVARGELALKQTDYGIEPPSAVAGTVKVADKVKLTFELHARRK